MIFTSIFIQTCVGFQMLLLMLMLSGAHFEILNTDTTQHPHIIMITTSVQIILLSYQSKLLFVPRMMHAHAQVNARNVTRIHTDEIAKAVQISLLSQSSCVTWE